MKKGSAQDATFIVSDPGHARHEEPREEGKTRRSKDGSFTRKNDRTYFGYKGHTIVDDSHIPMESIRRNLRISRKRSLVEYPYAIIKRVFHFSHVMVTMIRRVRMKFMFACFAYNLHAVKTLQG